MSGEVEGMKATTEMVWAQSTVGVWEGNDHMVLPFLTTSLGLLHAPHPSLLLLPLSTRSASFTRDHSLQCPDPFLYPSA